MEPESGFREEKMVYYDRNGVVKHKLVGEYGKGHLLAIAGKRLAVADAGELRSIRWRGMAQGADARLWGVVCVVDVLSAMLVDLRCLLPILPRLIHHP